VTDILEEWHPLMIAARIRKAIGGRTQQDAAAILGITPQYLCDILQVRRNLSPEVAARLSRLSPGLDGRYLYTMQEQRRVEIAWRRASEEPVQQPVSHETRATAYRKRAVKAARTRKRLKQARAAAQAEAGKMGEAKAA
jgi:plasmid maintenance system antidote protein VapI